MAANYAIMAAKIFVVESLIIKNPVSPLGKTGRQKIFT
jgi:hypothetical protein